MSAWIVDVQGGRHPFLPAGNRLRTGFPAFTSEGSQSLRAFQTAQRPLRLCRTACLGKRRRRESPLFWDMLGTPCAPAVAILPSAMYLPKRTSIRAKNYAFWQSPPPGGRGLPGPGQDLDTLPRDPDQVTSPDTSSPCPQVSVLRLNWGRGMLN